MNFDDIIELELKISTPFKTLFDLGYFLVDLNATLGITQKLFDGSKFAKIRNVYTSRRAIRGYKKYVQIKQYKSGSLIVEVATTVIEGLILYYIKKYLGRLEATRYNMYHIENLNIDIKLNSSDQKKIKNMLPKNLTGNPEIDIPEILKHIKNVTKSQIIYDENGVKYLIQNLKRLRSSIYPDIDYRA